MQGCCFHSLKLCSLLDSPQCINTEHLSAYCEAVLQNNTAAVHLSRQNQATVEKSISSKSLDIQT